MGLSFITPALLHLANVMATIAIHTDSLLARGRRQARPSAKTLSMKSARIAREPLGAEEVLE
jgi:hypothetical protein